MKKVIITVELYSNGEVISTEMFNGYINTRTLELVDDMGNSISKNDEFHLVTYTYYDWSKLNED